MKHRGPDSSGFALYGPPSDLLVMRVKLADPNEKRDIGWTERLERHRDEVEHRLAKIGAMVDVLHGDQDYAYRVTFRYSGDLKPLADYVEDVPGCEVLSLGHSLEIIKDLSDAESVAETPWRAGVGATTGERSLRLYGPGVSRKRQIRV